MEVFKALMRFFSYLFHTLLALFLFAVSGLAMASGGGSLHLGMLPWTGSTLIYVLFFGSLFGLLTIFLALRGTLRLLFFLWSLVVLVFLVKGYFLGGYRFGAGEFRMSLYLVLAAIIGILGAWFQMTRRLDRRRM